MAQDGVEEALPHLRHIEFAVQDDAAVEVHVFFQAREQGRVARQLDRGLGF
jgi:hypothetical protein